MSSNKKTQRALQRSYATETAPLFPHTGRPSTQRPGAMLQEDEEITSTLRQPAQWLRTRAVGLVSINLGFFSLGAAGVGFLLFYATFFSVLWVELFASGLVLSALLLIYGTYGVFAVCWEKVTPLVLYATTALLLVAATTAVEAFFFLEWTELNSDVDRGSLTSSMGRVWASDVNAGGTPQSRICSIQTMFECSGWHSGCWTLESSYPGDDSVASMLRRTRQEQLTGISLRMLNLPLGAVNNSNATQGGNCPLCFGDSVYTPYSQTCSDVLRQRLDAAVWYVLAAGVLVGALVTLNVLWAARYKKHRELSHATQELLDAQRYL